MSDWRQEGTLSTDSTWSDQFRIDFPEFAHDSPEIYPDSMINFWYGIAQKLLNIERWDDLLETGYKLFVAHNLLIEKNQQLAFAAGNFTGTPLGNISNKSVGDVSVGYDLSSFMEERGGEWNLTTYGRRFIFFVRLVGTGGAYV